MDPETCEMDQQKGPLRSALQEVLLSKMIRCVPSSEASWKVLVVDRAALRILAATVHLNELVNEGVSIIELLDIRREPLPSVPAVYFLTPTAETIELLSNESPSQYKSFRIFFTAHLTDFLLSVFKRKAKFIRRVKCFVELDVRFLALESRVFSLDRPAASMPQTRSGDSSVESIREEVSAISVQLAEVCKLVAPSVCWNVRSEVTSLMTRTLSSLVNEELRDLLKASKHHTGDIHSDQPQGSSAMFSDDSVLNDEKGRSRSPKKATLLIVDRVSDLATPLVHEYTYQAMAHDLLQLNYRKPGGAHVEVDDEKTGGKKFIHLDDEDKDPIWGSIRWLFIQEALEKAQQGLRHFVENDAAFKIRGKATKELGIKEMSAAVRALPQSQMKADKHAMHIQVTKSCLETASAFNLTQLALLEQDLVLGRAPDGTKLKPDEMVERIVDALRDESVPVAHRARLLLIALVVSEGLTGLGGETSYLSSSATFRGRLRRSSFEEAVDLSPEMQSAVDGIKRLLQEASDGFSRLQLRINPSLADKGESIAAKVKQKYAARQAQKRAKQDSKTRKMRHGSQTAEHYDVARYQPPLRSVMMDLVDDELDEVAFPRTDGLSVEAIIASNSLSPGGDTASSDLVNGNDPPSSHSTRTSSSRDWMSGRITLRKAFRHGDSGSRSGDSSGTDELSRPRMADPDHMYVVFVLGGVTYSEIRAMYDVCAKRSANIIIGGSDIITPSSFMRHVAAVSDPVVRIQVMLPPLPLELAITRAPEKSPKSTSANGSTPNVAGGDTRGPEEIDEEFERERMNGEVIEVVSAHKKKGFKVFRKKWG